MAHDIICSRVCTVSSHRHCPVSRSGQPQRAARTARFSRVFDDSPVLHRLAPRARLATPPLLAAAAGSRAFHDRRASAMIVRFDWRPRNDESPAPTESFLFVDGLPAFYIYRNSGRYFIPSGSIGHDDRRTVQSNLSRDYYYPPKFSSLMCR